MQKDSYSSRDSFQAEHFVMMVAVDPSCADADVVPEPAVGTLAVVQTEPVAELAQEQTVGHESAVVTLLVE